MCTIGVSLSVLGCSVFVVWAIQRLLQLGKVLTMLFDVKVLVVLILTLCSCVRFAISLQQLKLPFVVLLSLGM